MDLTNAYAMIANGGKEIKPTLIVSVHDKTGKQIINNENKKCINCIQDTAQINYNLPKIINNQKNMTLELHIKLLQCSKVLYSEELVKKSKI